MNSKELIETNEKVLKIKKEKGDNIAVIIGKTILESIIEMKIACIDEEIDNLEYLGLVKIKEKEPIEFETIYNNDTFNLVNNRIEKLKQEKEELNKKLEGLQ